jgi:hypothetical protein
LANELVFRDAASHLGIPGATSTLTRFTAAEAKNLFIADASGRFTNPETTPPLRGASTTPACLPSGGYAASQIAA